jgi:hypothetical protein
MKDMGLIYLATVYSSNPDGITNAHVQASALTAKLLRKGMKVYSPIAHTHPIAVYGNIDPYDHSIWLPFDEAIMDVSDTLLIAKMENWQISKGINHEINVFRKAGKPIYTLDPQTLEIAEYASA